MLGCKKKDMLYHDTIDECFDVDAYWDGPRSIDAQQSQSLHYPMQISTNSHVLIMFISSAFFHSRMRGNGSTRGIGSRSKVRASHASDKRST